MSKDRLTAFFDAVLAIVMTVLVLSLKQPATAMLSAVLALHKEYLTYATSFLFYVLPGIICTTHFKSFVKLTAVFYGQIHCYFL